MVDGGLYFEKVQELLCKMTEKHKIGRPGAAGDVAGSQARELARDRKVRFLSSYFPLWLSYLDEIA